MKKYALLGLAMIIIASSAFFAGLQWQKHRVRSELTDALGTQLVCTASGLLSDVTVATLLDKNDDRDAQDILLVDIKSAIAKLTGCRETSAHRRCHRRSQSLTA